MPGKEIATDKEAKLGVCDTELSYQGVRECRDRLELESHHRPGQEEHSEDEPPIAAHVEFPELLVRNNSVAVFRDARLNKVLSTSYHRHRRPNNRPYPK